MKSQLIKIVLFLLLLTFVNSSCNNYVEFYSTGEWRLEKYYYMGADSTVGYLQNHEDYKLNLKVSHGFVETQVLNEGPYAVTGSWDINDDAKKLRLVDSLNGTREFEVKETSTLSLKIEKGVEEWWLTRP
jgi:hypothetical protein